MLVNISEFKTNISKYVTRVKREDILITKNGRVVARLVAEDKNPKVEALMSMRGILKGNTMTIEDAKEERLAKQ